MLCKSHCKKHIMNHIEVKDHGKALKMLLPTIYILLLFHAYNKLLRDNGNVVLLPDAKFPDPDQRDYCSHSIVLRRG